MVKQQLPLLCVSLQVEWSDDADHQGVLVAYRQHLLLRRGGQDDVGTAGHLPR